MSYCNGLWLHFKISLQNIISIFRSQKTKMLELNRMIMKMVSFENGRKLSVFQKVLAHYSYKNIYLKKMTLCFDISF